MSCGVGHRSGWVLALLGLWRRPVVIALIGPLAWEPANASGMALKKTKDQKKKKICGYQMGVGVVQCEEEIG